MFNSFYIFILRMNQRNVTEGNFILAVIEVVATIAVVGIIRNT